LENFAEFYAGDEPGVIPAGHYYQAGEKRHCEQLRRIECVHLA